MTFLVHIIEGERKLQDGSWKWMCLVITQGTLLYVIKEERRGWWNIGKKEEGSSYFTLLREWACNRSYFLWCKLGILRIGNFAEIDSCRDWHDWSKATPTWMPGTQRYHRQSLLNEYGQECRDVQKGQCKYMKIERRHRNTLRNYLTEK